MTALEPRPLDGADLATGTPVGRRIVLGMLGAGALGILFGRQVQDTIARTLSPDVASLLPSGGRFRIYSVTGFTPRVPASEYALRVTGLVDTPLELSYADLGAMAATRLVKDFQCVTGWRVPEVPWVGVRLADVLDAAGVQSSAAAVTFRSWDGVYSESLTLRQARRDDVIVAYSMEDRRPIPPVNGGPVRLYVAPMYGYKSLKWLEQIDVVDRVEPGYWELRGYDVDAWIGRSNGRDDEPVG